MKENELEFSDWPMFDLLMTNEELCRELLEVVLNAPVSNIEYIIAENDIRPTLTNHGVRLDAYVKTENEVCNIEMQTVKRAKLGRRCVGNRGATLPLRDGLAHYVDALGQLILAQSLLSAQLLDGVLQHGVSPSRKRSHRFTVTRKLRMRKQRCLTKGR